MNANHTISKATCQAISLEIEAAIAPILEKHGLKMGNRRSQYGDLYKFTVEASITEVGANGVDLGTKDATAWKHGGYMFGFQDAAAALGAPISYGGKTYYMAGLRPRSRKMPLVLLGADGRTYNAPANATILQQLPGYDPARDWETGAASRLVQTPRPLADALRD